MEGILDIINKDFEILPPQQGISGAFGVVYFVRHKELKYTRAIKTLRVSNSDKSEEFQRKTKHDFIEECKKLMRLGNGSNPNIVKIHKCKIDNEPYFIEMDYVQGEKFSIYANSNFLPLGEVYHFISNIAGALAYCHNYKDEEGNLKSVIHNDLHSDNIIRREDNDEYILLDFGLSMENGEIIRSSKVSTGWCEFMPPERCDIELRKKGSAYINKPATPAWDVYSLGCLIFMALTGRAPFAYDVIKNEDGVIQPDQEILTRHTKVDIYKPWEKINELRKMHFEKVHPNEEYQEDFDCPEWLIRMIRKCMSLKTEINDPERRYLNAQEFLDDFEKRYIGKVVPIEEYDKLVDEKNDAESKLKDLLQDYNELEGRQIYKAPILRNWVLAIVLTIAFACNCLPYFDIEKQSNMSIGPTWIAISLLASLVLIGVAIYDTVISKSNK